MLCSLVPEARDRGQSKRGLCLQDMKGEAWLEQSLPPGPWVAPQDHAPPHVHCAGSEQSLEPLDAAPGAPPMGLALDSPAPTALVF